MIDLNAELPKLNKLAGHHENNSLLFNYLFNGLNIKCIFFSQPQTFMIGIADKNVAWQTEISNGMLSERIPNEAYQVIRDFLKSDDQYSNKAFFEKLKQQLDLIDEKAYSPQSDEINQLIKQCKTTDKKYDSEGERPFFDHWRRSRPSLDSLNKIQRYFGKAIKDYCSEQNITAVWSETPKRDSLTFANPKDKVIQSMPTNINKKGYIQRIKTIIPNSKKEVDIYLEGKNLILTGKNGCGKTQLINLLHNYLVKRIIEKKNPDINYLKNNLKSFQNIFENTKKSDSNYNFYLQRIKDTEAEIKEASNQIINFAEIEQLAANYTDGKVVCLKFEATRQAQIAKAESVVSIESLKQKEIQNNRGSATDYFEQYLVSYKTQQAYADSESIGNNPEEAKNIQNWFNKLEDDFKELFEDNQLTINFDYQNQCFLIQQADKEPYGFQQLSSGFSSILAVYTDLLTKVRLRDLAPNELEGIVLIDEIDAHLHVSLQRKIFSFLTNAFPNIQFIITTHSPFVVSSVNDAVIYDLSTLQAVNENLSMYSYEAILEGLFGVLPISDRLSEKIEQLGKYISNNNCEINGLKNLVQEIEPHETKLDPESLSFLKRAQLLINKCSRNS